ncbi:MAG TPA: hypothetical protein EYG72_00075 [Candidatus Pacebacteria bacterium]|nr:hypothetical protein [Candidatus Paceibacterota bacterium]
MESMYGVRRGFKKFYFTFVKLKVDEKIYLDNGEDEFFKVVKVTSFDFVFFCINFTVCDFYWNCM